MHLNPAIATLLEGLNNPSLPGVDLSLDRMVLLLGALAHPETQLPPVIHVAGTNGKGSTMAFLRAIYEAAGYRVHAYHSPHLVRFNERILLGGTEITDDVLLDVLKHVTDAASEIPVTFFEATTAAAFLAFAQTPADVLLLETGLGGRLDATNLVSAPLATIITPIDYDHMEFLGNTITSIAAEKAGIMKPRKPCFAGKQLPAAAEVLIEVAQKKNAPLTLHGHDWNYEQTADGLRVECGTKRWQLPTPSLAGAHQWHNAALASMVASSLSALPVTLADIQKGIATAAWPARLQMLKHGPLVNTWRTQVMLDGGHNLHAAHALRDWLQQQTEPVTLLWGMMKRKDARAFLVPLGPYLAGVITTPIPGNESYDAAELAAIATGLGIAQVNTIDAPEALQKTGEGILLIAGSLFLAGEVLKNHS